MRFIPFFLLIPALALGQSLEPAAAKPAAARDVSATLAAQPPSCDAVAKAFAALVAQGRQPGDVEAVVAARRTDLPCAVQAANAAATSLGITPAETAQWLMRHPESLQAAPARAPEGGAPDTVTLGRKLDCGLTYEGARLVSRPDGMRFVMTFRNSTGKTLLGRDLVGLVGGQPWRSTVRLGSPAEPPLGSADMLQWDPQAEQWSDTREVKSREVHVHVGGDHADGQRAPNAPVEPGATFEEWIAVTGVPADAHAEDIPVEFTTCRLQE